MTRPSVHDKKPDWGWALLILMTLFLASVAVYKIMTWNGRA